MFIIEAERLLKKVLPKQKFIFEKPPKGMGDLACTVAFEIAKLEKKNPKDIALDIVSKIKLPKESVFEFVKSVGPYINFYYKKEKFSEIVINEILKRRSAYGKQLPKKQKLLVEYFQVNTHKPVHIGHARPLFLGESLSRIAEFNGYKVIRVTYGGDIGPHVAKCLWGYLNLGLKPGEDKGKWLGELYAKASQRIKDNETLEQEVKEINKKLYDGNPELIKLWRMTRQWSIKHFKEVALIAGTRFDKWFWESQVEKSGLLISKKLLKEGIAELSNGAIIIDLEKYGLGIFVLVTNYGTPLYSAKDLGLAKLEFGLASEVIHLADAAQSLHFKQLFKTFELMGQKKIAENNHHLPFELVDLKGGKMSSRLGNVVLFTDLYDNMFKLALKEIKRRSVKEQVEARAHDIAISALKFGMLNYDLNKKIIFSMEEWLSFEGETGPYLQYSNARAHSILGKAGKFKKQVVITDDYEYELVKLLYEFPLIVKQAFENKNPPLIAHYTYFLAFMFNKFYEHCPVIKSGHKDSRLTLVKAFTIVMSSALHLLGLKPMNKM